MSIMHITWQQARDMVLERLESWIQTMPVSERRLKIFWGNYLISPNDMLREVQLLTETGKQIIAAELNKISQEVGVTYVIVG